VPVLIDTSAWIEFYHVKGDAEIKRLVTEILGREEVVTVAPVVAELLRGAKAAGDRTMIERTLVVQRLLPLGWDQAAVAATLSRTLERQGRRPPLIDLLIAAAALQDRSDVWHAGDEHYETIASVSALRTRNLKRRQSTPGLE